MGKFGYIKIPQFDKLIAQNEANIAEVGRIAAIVTDECADWALNEMVKGLHEDTGAAKKAVEITKIGDRVNVYHVTVGIDAPMNQSHTHGFYHALFQEYGSPTTKKMPWFRPVVDAIPGRWKKMVKSALKKAGYGGKK